MIWLIGNKGMLGTEVENNLKIYNLQYSATDKEVDITTKDVLYNYAANIFNRDESDWIINCSAYTAVDKAEDEPELAAKINTLGVKNIAECAKEFNAKLIHLSTDYVFDGTSSLPLAEDVATEPASVYGKTKLDGEKAIQAETGSFFIIRTAWLYGQYGPNFVFTMLKLMAERDSISVVNDQHGSPTNAKDLAALIVEIITQESEVYGIYHYSNEGNITWFDFAKEIHRLGSQKGLVISECIINPCNSEQFPAKAKRPKFSLLSKEKVKREFNIVVPDWKDSLADFFNKIEDLKCVN